jgi:hypothetical protein
MTLEEVFIRIVAGEETEAERAADVTPISETAPSAETTA